MQCLSLIAKAIGSKLAPFLQQIVPLLMTLMMKLDKDKSVDIDNELSEACLSTLVAIIRRCPREVTPYVPQLFEKSLFLVAYDPNYLYDDNEDEEMEEAGEDWGSDFDDEDQERADDDDDTSWKVRRGSIHIIGAVVRTRPDLLKMIVEEHALALVDRFKERVDDVKCDLLQTFDALLTTTVDTAPTSIDTELRSQASLVRQKSAGGSLGDMA